MSRLSHYNLPHQVRKYSQPNTCFKIRPYEVLNQCETRNWTKCSVRTVPAAFINTFNNLLTKRQTNVETRTFTIIISYFCHQGDLPPVRKIITVVKILRHFNYKLTAAIFNVKITNTRYGNG